MDFLILFGIFWVVIGLLTVRAKRGEVSALELRIEELERDLEKLRREVRRGEISDHRSFTHSSLSLTDSSVPISSIEQLLRSNQKISAIKLYREFTQAGLKEAKDAVDEIERRMQ